MPTESIRVVDPDNGAGADYTSLTSWESVEERDLTLLNSGDGEIATAKCRTTAGSADTSALTLTGSWVTDETRYIKIWTDPAESYRHPGKWDATKFRIEPVTARGIGIRENVVQIIGIQFLTTDNGIETLGGITVGKLLVDKCLIKLSGTVNKTGILLASGDAGTEARISNTIVYDFIGGLVGTGFEVGNANVTAYFHNCTAHNCRTGFSRTAGTATAKNCLSKCNAFDAGYTDFSGTFSGSNNNASSDGTAPGTSSRINQTFTFVDETNDDFHLAAGDAGAKGFGADLSADANFSFSDDIDGETRTVPWDIGADGIVAAGGGSLLKVWNGSAWVEKPLKYWDGAAWQPATMKRWNGSAWVIV